MRVYLSDNQDTGAGSMRRPFQIFRRVFIIYFPYRYSSGKKRATVVRILTNRLKYYLLYLVKTRLQ